MQHRNMSRMVSFWLLIGAIIVVGVLFYQVIAQFLLPLFLAMLLVVIFKPVHVWIRQRTGKRPALAALLTTLAVLLAVFVPGGIVVTMAVLEGRDLVQRMDRATLQVKVDQLRDRLGLDSPYAAEWREINGLLETLDERLAAAHRAGDPLDSFAPDLAAVAERTKALARQLGLTWPQLPSLPEEGQLFSTNAGQAALNDVAVALDSAQQLLAQTDWNNLSGDELNSARLAFAQHVSSVDQEFHTFQTLMLGGRLRAWLRDLANPDEATIERYTKQFLNFMDTHWLSVAGSTTAFLGRAVLATLIMIAALFFFLLDGPKMVSAIQMLSPLDDHYEQELLGEFDRVSRAVVLATLLSALAQGILAGIGFFFVGMQTVFLLMLLTTLLALIPFVGAAAVWVPCCLWLYFYEGRLGAAIGLAVYGCVVISMVDNIIKPLVLHGQSRLHPLLALISVLGGVAALGPIGILIGPMVVALLQTLLRILQRELTSFDAADAEPSGELATAAPALTTPGAAPPAGASRRPKKSP